MRRWRVRIGNFILTTLTQKTSLLINISNISLLFPPDTFMVITFASALRCSSFRLLCLNVEPLPAAQKALALAAAAAGQSR